MAYKGRQQMWCPNGHYAEKDANAPIADCEVCGALPKIVNFVDDSEGKAEGYITPVVSVPASDSTCSCGNKHEKTPAVYRIPELTI